MAINGWSDEVIRRVEQLAAQQGQPLMENGPIFECTPGEIIADPEDDIKMMTIEMEGVNYDDEEDDFIDARYIDGIIHDDDENGRGIIIAPSIVTDEDDVDHSEDDDEYDENGCFEEVSPIEELIQPIHEQEEEIDE